MNQINKPKKDIGIRIMIFLLFNINGEKIIAKHVMLKIKYGNQKSCGLIKNNNGPKKDAQLLGLLYNSFTIHVDDTTDKKK